MGASLLRVPWETLLINRLPYFAVTKRRSRISNAPLSSSERIKRPSACRKRKAAFGTASEQMVVSLLLLNTHILLAQVVVSGFQKANA